MGGIIEYCDALFKIKRKRKKKTQQIHFDFKMIYILRQHPNNSSSEIKIKTDNLVKVYSYSPFLIYEVLDNIDSGAYGSVQRVCFKKRKEIVRAIKIIDKDSIAKGQTDRLFEEIEILRKLEYPNIMKIYEYYNRKNNIYII